MGALHMAPVRNNRTVRLREKFATLHLRSVVGMTRDAFFQLLLFPFISCYLKDCNGSNIA